MQRVQYAAGTTLFVQGAPGDAAYIVESGAVGLYHLNDAGRQIHLGTMTRSCLFGEMSVIDGSPRMATALVEEDAELMRIPSDMLRAKMQGTDPFVRGVIKIMMENLRTVHRIYLKYPRSFADHVASLRETTQSLARFSAATALEQESADAARYLALLSQAVAGLDSLVEDGVGKDLEGPDPLAVRPGLQT